MTVAPNDVVRITAVMKHSLEGDVMNVYHVKQQTDEATDYNFMVAARLKLEAIYGILDNYMPDTLSFYEIRGYNITQDNPLPTLSWSTLDTGDVDVADPMSSVSSALGLLRTGVTRVLGKKYYGPFTEADHTDAHWGSAILTAVAGAIASMMQQYTSGDGVGEIGVWSEKLQTWYPIIEGAVNNIIAYQRKRKHGVGV